MSGILSGSPVLIIACFVIGIGLVVIEALTPGLGLPGISGTVLLAAGVYLMWTAHGSAAGLFSLLGVLIVAAAAVLLSIKSAASGRLSKSKLILNEETPGADLKEASSLEGSQGVAITVMNPVGEIEINGKHMEALSDGGLLPKGTPVRVVRTEGKKIIVRGL